jgi:hypothetical protein
MVRVLTVTLALFLSLSKDYSWGVGALLGGAILEVNLSLFKRFVAGSQPGRLRVPLWITLVKFYGLCLATMLACFLVVKFKLGNPLAFLLGLGVFIPSVVVGLGWYLFTRKPSPPPSPDWGYRPGGATIAPSSEKTKDERQGAGDAEQT